MSQSLIMMVGPTTHLVSPSLACVLIDLRYNFMIPFLAEIIINFEEISYTVVENEDEVEVCITINTPADRDIRVNGNIMAGEAIGKYH